MKRPRHSKLTHRMVLALALTAAPYAAVPTSAAAGSTPLHAIDQAGQTTIKGHILDPQGEPIVGATVKVSGAKGLGTVTDIDGAFTISNAPANGTLEVSY